MNNIVLKDKLEIIKLAILILTGFTDNKVLVSEDGIESVTCCRSDGMGFQESQKLV